MKTKREKALALTDADLLKLKAEGALPSVAQALGISGRGTPDELLARIRAEQRKVKK